MSMRHRSDPVVRARRPSRRQSLILAVIALGLMWSLGASGFAGVLAHGGAVPPSASLARHQASGTPAGTPAPGAATPAPPRPASPVPATPTAVGCGGPASSATEIAEVFVAAATADDLARATRCVDPTRRITSWDDLFLGDTAGADLITGCQDQPYTVYVATIDPDMHTVIFDFAAPCVLAPLDDWQQRLYDTETLMVPVFLVQLDYVEGRWYVRDALASVPD